ncbi:hypothetical protein MN608_03242 [Microdochium nivale]|nr:hypothetical protein MN608_03242 [Microdochium nivale]
MPWTRPDWPTARRHSSPSCAHRSQSCLRSHSATDRSTPATGPLPRVAWPVVVAAAAISAAAAWTQHSQGAKPMLVRRSRLRGITYPSYTHTSP